MATNLAIDPALLNRALEASDERTKKAVVTRALEEFIARREQRKIVAQFGTLEWDDAYDHKADRGARDRKLGHLIDGAARHGTRSGPRDAGR